MRTLTFQQQNSPLVSRATAHLQTGHSRTEVPTVVTSAGTHYCPEHVPSRCLNQAGNTGRVGEEGNGHGLSGLPGTHPSDVGKCWWGCLVLLAAPFFYKDSLKTQGHCCEWNTINALLFLAKLVLTSPRVPEEKKKLDNEIKEHVWNVSKAVLRSFAQVMQLRNSCLAQS